MRLKKDLARHLAHGHPWIWADALSTRPTGPARIGDIADANGAFAARGIVDPGGAIAVRVLTRDPGEVVDERFVRARIEDALALRRRVLPADADALRLVHGEADGLPGVVVDRYANTLVLRFDSDAVRKTLSEWVVAALRTTVAPARIVERRPEDRGTGRPAETIFGDDPPDEIEVHEGTVRVGVDVRRGQKTGLFLDQRDNHIHVARLCAGARVLNLFSYTGGFGLHAACSGAREVTCVDSAAPALDAARRNFARNGIDHARHRFELGDAFRWTEAARRRPDARWDVVIVDPPSLAPSERAVPRALAAYRRLLGDATVLVTPGGLLVASSCSSHVKQAALLGAAAAGAAASGRVLQVVELRGAGPDHPVLPAFPEGHYLDLFIARPISSSGGNVDDISRSSHSRTSRRRP